MARALPIALACAALAAPASLLASDPSPRPRSSGRATVGLSARLVHAGDRTGLEAILGITLPLDRVLMGPRALAEPAGPAPPAAPVATPEMARACVRAAWRAAGFGDDNKLDALASRARISAALPELQLRAARTTDESGRISYLDADTPHYAQAGSATYWLEAKLTFRLDRLLFADDEVALERARVDRVEARGRIAVKVLKALFEWQRAVAQSSDATLLPAERASAEMAAMEAAATVDVLTDGWFGRAALGR
jgi:hypothetical protein